MHEAVQNIDFSSTSVMQDNTAEIQKRWFNHSSHSTFSLKVFIVSFLNVPSRYLTVLNFHTLILSPTPQYI